MRAEIIDKDMIGDCELCVREDTKVFIMRTEDKAYYLICDTCFQCLKRFLEIEIKERPKEE